MAQGLPQAGKQYQKYGEIVFQQYHAVFNPIGLNLLAIDKVILHFFVNHFDGDKGSANENKQNKVPGSHTDKGARFSRQEEKEQKFGEKEKSYYGPNQPVSPGIDFFLGQAEVQACCEKMGWGEVEGVQGPVPLKKIMTAKPSYPDEREAVIMIDHSN